MRIPFEHYQHITHGSEAVAYHSPANRIQIIIRRGGNMILKDADTSYGSFADRDFSDGVQLMNGTDTTARFFKAKNVPGVNFFLMWRRYTAVPEHRLAVFNTMFDAGRFLENGNFTMNHDSPIISASFTFENAGNILADERESMIGSGTQILLYFTSGENSRPIPMGKFYVDSDEYDIADNTISVNARNASGKLLKDQTLDENHRYEYKALPENIRQLFENAGVPDYSVQEGSGFEVGLLMQPNTTFYDAIREFLNTILDWEISEGLNGVIAVGNRDYLSRVLARVNQYDFHRERDIFSRKVKRDDKEVYSRVCVHTSDFETTVYEDVNFPEIWTMPVHKTMYITVPDGTSTSDARARARNVAQRMSNVGIIEEFAGPFRPHLVNGDEARIMGEADIISIGTVTSIKHDFGKSGFFTSFVVDSGGVLKKPDLKTLIDEVSNPRGKNDEGSSGSVERLY
jgi:hypothetical protein